MVLGQLGLVLGVVQRVGAEVVAPGQRVGADRVLVGGVAVLGVALLGGAVLLATGDDDGESESAPTSAEDPAALTQLLSDERSGLKVQYPAGWKRSEREGYYHLLS